MKFVWQLLAAMLLLGARPTCGDEFQDTIQPYLKKYCVECHQGEKAKAELDLALPMQSADLISQFRRWQHIIEFVRSGEMPPEESPQPGIPETNQFVAAIRSILLTEARQQASDPGVVLPRRLSNSEFDFAIRDLTGVDIRPTRDFPADPAGGEGFDNTGEALRMSPNLLKKYLSAAQHVSEHLVLKPGGIVFAPFPVTSYNERKKLTEQAVIDFYQSHAVDIGEYIEAAWRYRYRPDTAVTLEQWAASRKLSSRYLATVWNFLNSTTKQTPIERELSDRWHALPSSRDEVDHSPELRALIELIVAYRQLLSPPAPELIKSNAGNWPIQHLDFRAKVAASRNQFQSETFHSRGLVLSEPIPQLAENALPTRLLIHVEQLFSEDRPYVLFRQPIFSRANHLPRNDKENEEHKVESLQAFLTRTESSCTLRRNSQSLTFGKHPLGQEIDAESLVVQIPDTLEISLSAAAQKELAGRRLLLPCEIDLEHSSGGGVTISAVFDGTPLPRFPAHSQFLIHPASTGSLTPGAEALCQTFPQEFFYVDRDRGLTAGFHLVEGFFRDDQPLVNLVLSNDERAELDRLWQELDFVTESAETLLRGFVWFERSEREVLHDERFDFLRPEDPELVTEKLLGKFERLYLDKLGVKRLGDTLEPETPSDKYTMVHGFFEEIRRGLTRHQELLHDAEPRGLADLERLAERAWRRPLTADELQSLRTLYQSFRQEGQSVEASLRSLLTAIVMSPHFCYFAPDVAEGQGVSPIRDLDMASKLSLFLWSSLPDQELLAAATQGQLHTEDQLAAQARRMLKDPRVARFSREFLGQWLRYRDYIEKDPIHGEAFPGYTEELRAAIFEEPTQLATWLIQEDRPVTELLTSDVTFVNEPLANHYGGAIQQRYREQLGKTPLPQQFDRGEKRAGSVWLQVDGLAAAGRGGLVGMSIILTKNSAGERTSPVKRGFWTVHHLLGQHFPPPPADVPELPKSEKEAPKTIRELLAAHVAESKCAMCHRHFDSLGLAMEGFDALGRSRTHDSAGRMIDNRAELPGGQSAQGVPELIRYLDQQRRDEFVETLCHKFLGYALGRSIRLSDEPLLSEMKLALEQNGYRFSILFETVIRSPQFRLQRNRDHAP
jgi:hypothetical protein